MDTHETLLAAALKVLEEDGEAQFSTRNICALANVTAPTFYHHYGSADGLLSAAITEAFRQWLESKKAAVTSPDPATALRQGWDDYVRFAAARPRLYAAMITRVLNGATIPAAEQGAALLVTRIRAIAAQGRLALTVKAAADLTWASANAAALLFVTTQIRKTSRPDPAVIDGLREHTMQTILKPERLKKFCSHSERGFLKARPARTLGEASAKEQVQRNPVTKPKRSQNPKRLLRS